MLTAIDHMIIAVRDLAEAAAPFEKLGLQLTSVTRHTTGNANRALFVGSENSEFYIELLLKPCNRSRENTITLAVMLY